MRGWLTDIKSESAAKRRCHRSGAAGAEAHRGIAPAAATHAQFHRRDAAGAEADPAGQLISNLSLLQGYFTAETQRTQRQVLCHGSIARLIKGRRSHVDYTIP
jgi:hypothetical protein